MKSFIHNFFNKSLIVGSTIALSLAGATLTACSGEDGVDGKDALAGVRCHQMTDNGTAKAGLAHAALACHGNNFGFGLGLFHEIPSMLIS